MYPIYVSKCELLQVSLQKGHVILAGNKRTPSSKT